LAAVLADQGEQVVLVDATRNPGDIAQATGAGPAIEHGITDVLAGSCSAVEALAPGPAGTLLLANRPGRKVHAEYSRPAQQRLLTQLRSLHKVASLIVIDAGCDVLPWTLRLWSSASLSVLVTTTDDLAVIDAYAAIKRHTATVPHASLRIVANRCDSDAVATDLYRRLGTASQRFLARDMQTLPPLPAHPAKNAASVPRVWESLNTPFGHAALWLGRAVSNLLHPVEDERAATTAAREQRRYSGTFY
jgi:MinD-like ATPase involved in chromosome partitioning or flagellar assembly